MDRDPSRHRVMSMERGPDGKFRRYSDDTFAEVTNKEILVEVQTLGTRVGKIENRLDNFHRLASLITPSITCVAGVLASYWYAKN